MIFSRAARRSFRSAHKRVRSDVDLFSISAMFALIVRSFMQSASSMAERRHLDFLEKRDRLAMLCHQSVCSSGTSVGLLIGSIAHVAGLGAQFGIVEQNGLPRSEASSWRKPFGAPSCAGRDRGRVALRSRAPRGCAPL
jgi:hypothetical protein